MYKVNQIHLNDIEAYLNSQYHDGYELDKITYKDNNVYLIVLKKRTQNCL